MSMKTLLKYLLPLLPLLFACRQPESLTVGIAETCLESRASVGRSYVNAIIRGGHTPVVIPDSPGAASLLRKVDLLLLIGGKDIEPWRYGEEAIEDCGPFEPARDAFEYRLMDEAVRLRKPVFGICRGAQLINVYFGGTLYQDIPSQYDTTICHRHGGELIRELAHGIMLVEGSRLQRVLGCDSLGVNSTHHQAVKDLAPGLRISATAPDGTVEAIESETLPIAGVQFHPEQLAVDTDTLYTRIFTHILSLAGAIR